MNTTTTETRVNENLIIVTATIGAGLVLRHAVVAHEADGWHVSVPGSQRIHVRLDLNEALTIAAQRAAA